LYCNQSFNVLYSDISLDLSNTFPGKEIVYSRLLANEGVEDLVIDNTSSTLANKRAPEVILVSKRGYLDHISDEHHTSTNILNKNIFKEFFNNKKSLYHRSKRIVESNYKPNYVFYSDFNSEIDYLFQNPMAFAR